MTSEAMQFLLRATAGLAEHELSCDETGDCLHRYVEHLAQRPSAHLPPELQLVAQHLSICPECQEIVDAVVAALRANTQPGDLQDTGATSPRT